ncbi:hypothetical protein PISMIDRAFT_685688 [Pisolithus microcarpus 441]|uniref:Uncharacterized protein n=1 Tax=Pisolithus microcarpus 441 TaxID=765257 RepID=A0A0C9Z3S6_9AGAM|nr:hypothetical protein PISMIDRAFT_685688 [Pisolithus microcarpus 441]
MSSLRLIRKYSHMCASAGETIRTLYRRVFHEPCNAKPITDQLLSGGCRQGSF